MTKQWNIDYESCSGAICEEINSDGYLLIPESLLHKLKQDAITDYIKEIKN